MIIDNVIIEESFRSEYTALILLKTMGQVVGSNDLRDDTEGVLTAVHVTSIVKSERKFSSEVEIRAGCVFLFRPRNFTQRDFSNNTFCGLRLRDAPRLMGKKHYSGDFCSAPGCETSSGKDKYRGENGRISDILPATKSD